MHMHMYMCMCMHMICTCALHAHCMCSAYIQLDCICTRQAGGLEPAELPAHRIYLRHLADGAAAALADALIAAAAAAPRAEPSPLADEVSAH